MPSPEAATGSTPALPKALGLRDVTLFFITAGVNFQWVATAAVAGPLALTGWFIGLLLMSLPLAVCVVDLSSRYPDEGGLYVWTKKAFGDFPAFLMGWTYWMSNLPYFPGLLYFAAGNALAIAGARFRHLDGSPLYYILFSTAGLALGTWMNLVGLKVGRRLSNAGAYARWVGGLALIAAGVLAFMRHGSANEFNAVTLAPSFAMKDLLFWSTIAFALTGLESASFMGDEIKDARRTVPRALFLAMPTIVLLYVLGSLAIVVTLPQGEATGLQGIVDAAGAMQARLAIPGLAPMIAIAVVVASLGSVGAWLGAVARIPFVAGLDRYLPSAFARIHPRWGTPHVSLLVQAGVTMIFVLLGQAGTTVKGAYDVLIGMMVLIYMIPFLFLYPAAARLQFTAPDAGAPSWFRFRGARWVVAAAGVVGFLTTCAAVVLSCIPAADEPNKPLAVLKIVGGTALIVACGVAVFRARRHKATPAPAAPRA
ncbi:MAG TPA: APC family permease [Candidatus Polarisedimenticolia bacterium]|nr:APC family permease [Candidatus Polarisedimenticolia bacterium]